MLALSPITEICTRRRNLFYPKCSILDIGFHFDAIPELCLAMASTMARTPSPLFPRELPSEKVILPAQAKRAIWIDFEGYVKEAPALIGVLIDGEFEQILLDDRFAGAASYGGAKPMRVIPGTKMISDLLKRAISEDRKIVAFSSLEKEQCLRWYGTDISSVYVNAKSVAKRWAKTVRPGEKIRTLKDFEALAGFQRSKDTGFRRNTSCLNAALRDLRRYGELHNPSPKRHWTNLRKHNRQDVEAMQHIVLQTFHSSDL